MKRTVRLLTLVGLVGSCAYAIWLAVWATVPATCETGGFDRILSFTLTTLSISGFVMGHLFGHILESGPGSGYRGGGGRITLTVQLVLIGLLVSATSALFYETYAVIHDKWPITSYIRCFAHLWPLEAGIGAFALFFLLGHWIWYPNKNGAG